jgi:hypothetical protein
MLGWWIENIYTYKKGGNPLTWIHLPAILEILWISQVFEGGQNL